MKNCASRYSALSHHPLLAHRLFWQNSPAPIDDHPRAFSSISDTLQIFYCSISLLLFLLPWLSNTVAGTILTGVYDPQPFRICLSQTHIVQLSYKPIASLVLLLLLSVSFSYISDTIPNDTSLHKPHDSYSSRPHGYYINGLPFEGNPLMRFSSPTKSRSIQTLSS